MKNDADDQKVIELLSKLRNDKNAYPFDLLKSRRKKYLQQAAQLGLGIGVGAGLRNALKGRAPSLPPTAGKLLELALVVAIVAEASTAAYFYRHTLANLFKTFLTTASVGEVTPPSAITSPLPVAEISMIPTVTPTATTTPMATITPGPVTVDDNSNNNSNNNGSTAANSDNGNGTGGGNNPADSTPDPNGNNGNNGNHYGQTEQPPKPSKEPKDTKVPKD